ncbi:alpha/beta fold hydrolase [Mesorhizobium amorphae]|uniref:alpha/beta fold hydrolase n=1 Tax=Mesorhizobium amorphae TaxID=71433 RepID=UPI0009D99AF4|nr:alpha/beta hydrolase [Mesorhizobium amorphae]
MTQFVTCSEGRFAYLSWGEEGAPIVFCLHGFPDTPHSFSDFATKLSSLGYRVIAPWLRGYAPSTLDGPITTEQLVKDIKSLIDAISPNKKVFIVAHDWGAALTYLTLSQYPQLFLRAVTASVPHPTVFFKSIVTKPSQFKKSWYILFFQLGPLADYFVSRNNFSLIEKLWRTWSPGYALSASQWNIIKECLSQSMPKPVMYYRAMFWPPLPALKQLRAANKVHTPLLYVHGVEDGCINLESRRGQENYFMAAHQEVLLEGVGHFVALEAPDRLAQEAHRWFQG